MSPYRSHLSPTSGPSLVFTIETSTSLPNLRNPEAVSETPLRGTQVNRITTEAKNRGDMRREEAVPLRVAGKCRFCWGLGIGYRVSGVSRGWLSTSTCHTILTSTLRRCSWCRTLVTSPWWLSLCMECCPMLYILVVLVEYLMYSLEVSLASLCYGVRYTFRSFILDLYCRVLPCSNCFAFFDFILFLNVLPYGLVSFI